MSEHDVAELGYIRDIAHRFLEGQSSTVSDLQRLSRSPWLPMLLTHDDIVRLTRTLQSSSLLQSYLDATFLASVYREKGPSRFD